MDSSLYHFLATWPLSVYPLLQSFSFVIGKKVSRHILPSVLYLLGGVCLVLELQGEALTRAIKPSCFWILNEVTLLCLFLLLWHSKTLRLQENRVTFVKQLQLGSCVGGHGAPSEAAGNVFIYHCLPSTLPQPFSLFCPRPLGSDRDQLCFYRDEVTHQNLN